MEDQEENNCRQRFIGDPELTKAYEHLHKAEAELEELKAMQRFLEKLVKYLETRKGK